MALRLRHHVTAGAAGALALALAGGQTAAAAQYSAAAAQRTVRAPTALGSPSVPYAVWLRDVQAVADQAGAYLTARLADGTPQSNGHLGVVLDIDNTSLESGYSPSLPTPAVQAVLKVARAVHSRGGKVFFVTARPDFVDWFTRDNLTRVGYPVDGLYGRDFLNWFQETGAFKTSKRAEIEAAGYTVVANIGNNTTDLVGGHAERTFKLPDYNGQLS